MSGCFRVIHNARDKRLFSGLRLLDPARLAISSCIGECSYFALITNTPARILGEIVILEVRLSLGLSWTFYLFGMVLSFELSLDAFDESVEMCGAERGVLLVETHR